TVTEEYGSRVVTYRQTWQRVGALAAALSARGVRAGDRVVAVLPNQVDLVCLWFAVNVLGATLVPLDPRLTEPELAALVTHADPVLVVLTPDGSAPAGRQTLHSGPGLDEAATLPAPTLTPPADPTAPTVVLYTSGSTGRPKGCVLSHDSLVLPAGHMVERLRMTEDDVLLHVLPLHHMAGLSFLTTAVAAGAGVALVPRFSGTRFWAQAAASGATVFRHLGEMIAVLCARQPTSAERHHSLRLAYGAGATPTVAARFTARFGVPTLEGYGLSETNTVLCGTLDDPRPGTLGRPLPHVRVRLMDATGEVRGAGVGELQVGPNPALLQGYLGAPELTAAAFDDGWYRTGDLVRRDSDGELRFVRRINDVIRRRGENIDPAEIERVAESCSGVRRAAAVGVVAELDGVDIKLYLEPVAGRPVVADDVLAHCARRLAPFKLPRYVEIVDRLPLTATQKVDKVALARHGGSPHE
ncbi:MAG TPA: AMP-binding protein, partial [Pseudonocardiaceae bacterium]|nr:AMP-binding protein [Pseudonocardiaceae bacterium]